MDIILIDQGEVIEEKSKYSNKNRRITGPILACGILSDTIEPLSPIEILEEAKKRGLYDRYSPDTDDDQKLASFGALMYTWNDKEVLGLNVKVTGSRPQMFSFNERNKIKAKKKFDDFIGPSIDDSDENLAEAESVKNLAEAERFRKSAVDDKAESVKNLAEAERLRKLSNADRVEAERLRKLSNADRVEAERLRKSAEANNIEIERLRKLTEEDAVKKLTENSKDKSIKNLAESEEPRKLAKEETGNEYTNSIDAGQDMDEENVVGISPSKRNVHTTSGNLEISSLHDKAKRGKLVLQPSFQRRFVWDNKKSSRLIESALLGLPLPTIYLSEEKDGKEYVIDGQQRLTTFFSFIDGKFPDEKPFRLTGLGICDELNDKSYVDLLELKDHDGKLLQDNVTYYKIPTIILSKDTDPIIKFDIFERLNYGADNLTQQELRNSMYRGGYNDLLKKLSQDKDFMYISGYEKPDPRMVDVERVLRFAAFYHTSYLDYKSPMKEFFNDDMRKYQHISEVDKNKLIVAFKNSVSIIRYLLGDRAFKRFYGGSDKCHDGYWSNTFNASLYDILMWSFAKEEKNTVMSNLDAIREALIDLMSNDKEFISTIEMSTSSVQAVRKRFDKWRLTLQEIIGINQKEIRCFPFKLKQKLYDNGKTCAICGNEIQDIDDAAIDHIEQYWRGGKTIPENARLAHRYCNSSRPRKDKLESVPATMSTTNSSNNTNTVSSEDIEVK